MHEWQCRTPTLILANFDQIFMNHNRLMSVRLSYHIHAKWCRSKSSFDMCRVLFFVLFEFALIYFVHLQSKNESICIFCSVHYHSSSHSHSHPHEIFAAITCVHRSIISMPIHFRFWLVYQNVIIKFGKHFHQSNNSRSSICYRSGKISFYVVTIQCVAEYLWIYMSSSHVHASTVCRQKQRLIARFAKSILNYYYEDFLWKTAHEVSNWLIYLRFRIESNRLQIAINERVQCTNTITSTPMFVLSIWMCSFSPRVQILQNWHLVKSRIFLHSSHKMFVRVNVGDSV